MKILLVGGTGFLGYHATKELFACCHEVTILALPSEPLTGLIPVEVEIYLTDTDSFF